MISKRRHLQRGVREDKLYNRYFSITNYSGVTNISPYTTDDPDAAVLQISRDRQTWTVLDNTVSISHGAKVFLRSQSSDAGLYKYPNFKITGDSAGVGGNLLSLCYGSNIGILDKNDAYYQQWGNSYTKDYFKKLFNRYDNPYDEIAANSTIKSSRFLLLPLKTVPANGYEGMFYNCTSLINTPIIKAESVESHGMAFMFYNCESLTKPAVLKVKTVSNLNSGIAHMAHMYEDCRSLNIEFGEPFILPSTTLNQSYYKMFANCTSLEFAPIMPAYNIHGWCYRDMFENCVKLRTVITGATNAWDSYGNDGIQWLEDCGGFYGWLNGAGTEVNNKKIAFGILKEPSGHQWHNAIEYGNGVIYGGDCVPEGWDLTVNFNMLEETGTYGQNMSSAVNAFYNESKVGIEPYDNVYNYKYDYLYRDDMYRALKIWNYY